MARGRGAFSSVFSWIFTQVTPKVAQLLREKLDNIGPSSFLVILLSVIQLKVVVPS